MSYGHKSDSSFYKGLTGHMVVNVMQGVRVTKSILTILKDLEVLRSWVLV